MHLNTLVLKYSQIRVLAIRRLIANETLLYPRSEIVDFSQLNIW